MIDIISMLITLVLISYVIGTIFKKRQEWMDYLFRIGNGARQKISPPVFFVSALVLAGISLRINLWVSRQILILHPVLKAILFVVTWEIIAILLVLLLACIYITIKEIKKVNDRMVNGILLYSIIILSLQLIQLKQNQIEIVECSLLIDAVAYIFNMVCIFHITGKTFEKEVAVKNVWSTMMINMTFIILELSSMVYQVQKLPIENCFNVSIESFTDCIYYVLISFFTVGYGDIYPIAAKAKAISLVIVVTGFLFTAVFFAIAMSITTDKIQQKQEQKE